MDIKCFSCGGELEKLSREEYKCKSCNWSLHRTLPKAQLISSLIPQKPKIEKCPKCGNEMIPHYETITRKFLDHEVSKTGGVIKEYVCCLCRFKKIPPQN